MSETMNLSEFGGALKRNKVMVSLLIILPAILTIIVTEFIPKRYTSSITLLCPETLSGGSVSSGGGISGILSGFRSSTRNAFTTQGLKILVNSDYMCLDVINKFNIKKLYKIKKTQDAILFVKEKLIKIDVLDNDGIIILSATSNSPKLSRDIVEFIYDNLGRVNNELKFTTITPLTKVVNRPFIPYKKSYPSMKLNVSIAILFGLLLSLAYVYFDIIKSDGRKRL